MKNITTDLPAIANRLANLKGQFVGLNWKRNLKTYKGETRKVTKSVRTVARVGIEYDNRAAVIEGRENGQLPVENAGLNGKEWVQYPVLLRSLKTGKLLVRVYPVKDASGKSRACKAVYRIDGQTVTREAAKVACLASEFSSTPSPFECFDVPAEAITALRLVKRADAKAAVLSV